MSDTTDEAPKERDFKQEAVAGASEQELRHVLAVKRSDRLKDCTEEELEAELARRGLKP